MGPVVMIEKDGVQSFWEINAADEPDLRNWCATRGRSLDPESLRPTQAAPGLDYPKNAEVVKDAPLPEAPKEQDSQIKGGIQKPDSDPFSMDNK